MNMKTYRNTFEIFGDPAPCEAESEREYARAILGLFPKVLVNQKPYYQFEAQDHRVGMSNEIDWCDRVWADCIEKTNDEDDEDYDDRLPRTGLIDEETFLNYLEEAVEEVQEEGELREEEAE